MTNKIIITAGSGPLEVREFVAQLARRMEALCHQVGLPVASVITRGPADAPGSVELALAGDDLGMLHAELGTHALWAPSRHRNKGSRKRWFARVALVPLDDMVEWDAAGNDNVRLRAEDVCISACRASGPGGQHVNTTASAVRALHHPTGISVRVETERSQHANRAAALAMIERELHRRAVAKKQMKKRQIWREHYRVERGNPVRTYKLDRSQILEVIHG